MNLCHELLAKVTNKRALSTHALKLAWTKKKHSCVNDGLNKEKVTRKNHVGKRYEKGAGYDWRAQSKNDRKKTQAMIDVPSCAKSHVPTCGSMRKTAIRKCECADASREAGLARWPLK